MSIILDKIYDLGYEYPLAKYNSGEHVFYELIGADDFVISFISQCVSDESFFMNSAWSNFNIDSLSDENSCVRHMVKTSKTFSFDNSKIVSSLLDCFRGKASTGFISLFDTVPVASVQWYNMSVNELMRKLYTMFVIHCLIADYTKENTYNNRSIASGLDLAREEAKNLFYSLDLHRNYHSDFIFSQVMTVYHVDNFFNDLINHSENFTVRKIIDKFVVNSMPDTFFTIYDAFEELSIEISYLIGKNYLFIGDNGFNLNVFWRNFSDLYENRIDRVIAAIIADWIEEEVYDNSLQDKSEKEIINFFEKTCFAVLTMYYFANRINNLDKDTIITSLKTLMKVDGEKVKKLRIINTCKKGFGNGNFILNLNIFVGQYM